MVRSRMAGGLAATVDDASWVLTSYLVANAIVLPISGWLSIRLGRKRFYMSCVVIFTVSSFLCKATLAMLVSSTSMNVANETTAAITHGLTRRFAGVDERRESMIFGAAAIASPKGPRMASHPHRRFHRHSGRNRWSGSSPVEAILIANRCTTLT